MFTNGQYEQKKEALEPEILKNGCTDTSSYFATTKGHRKKIDGGISNRQLFCFHKNRLLKAGAKIQNPMINKYIAIPAIIISLGGIAVKVLEYQYFKFTHGLEIYLSVIGLLFLSIGFIIGRKWHREQKKPEERLTEVTDYSRFGITEREFEVLTLIAMGYSNRQIAEKLFLSLPTIKTHTSNLFVKLDVQRRTQAVNKAKELNILE